MGGQFNRIVGNGWDLNGFLWRQGTEYVVINSSGGEGDKSEISILSYFGDSLGLTE